MTRECTVDIGLMSFPTLRGCVVMTVWSCFRTSRGIEVVMIVLRRFWTLCVSTVVCHILAFCGHTLVTAGDCCSPFGQLSQTGACFLESFWRE